MAIVLRVIGFILVHRAVILDAVARAEKLIGATGDEKKAHALEIVRLALSTRGIFLTDGQMQMMSGTIDLIVAAYHAFGVWRHRTASQSPQA